jgi:hypothetical protein
MRARPVCACPCAEVSGLQAVSLSTIVCGLHCGEANMGKASGQISQYCDQGQGRAAARLEDDPQLRAHLPPDTPDVVERTYKRWNKTLRERLGSETGLRLANLSVPVRVVDGLPRPFAEILRKFDDPDLWWLAAHQELLRVTQRGLTELSRAAALPRPLLSDSGVDERSRRELDGLICLIDKLLATEQAKKLDDELRSINEDLLGAYFFMVRRLSCTGWLSESTVLV